MKITKFTVLICFFLLFSVTARAEIKKTLTFCIGTEATDAGNAYFDFLQIAYAELGHDLILKRVPIKRTFVSLDNGSVDGIVITTPNIIKTYKNISIIPEPLTTIEVTAFTNGKTFNIDGPKSLQPYRIGIMRGYVLTEKLTKGLNRQIVNNYHSLFSILLADRVDVIFVMKREAKRFIKKNPQYKHIKALDPPFFSVPLYHALHRKYDALIPKITPIIERLIKEKVLEKLYKPYEI